MGDDSTRLRRHPSVLWRRSGDRHLLLCPQSPEPVLLEGVGSAVWRLLADPISPRELETTLSAAYGMPRETVRAELIPFLSRLVELGAVDRR